MRLFFAINFSEREKDILLKNIAALKGMCSRGNFTSRENLHLTLAFLGEVDNAELETIRAAAESVRALPFEIETGGAGMFGSIAWLGVAKGKEELSRLAGALRGECDRAGVGYDKKPFSPHLTICRETKFLSGNDIAAFEEKTVSMKKTVSSFELMESTRTGGKLVYKKIFSKKF